MSPSLHLIALACTWLAYGLVHSLLAAEKTKRLFRQYLPGYFRAYRLLYNLLAGLLLLPPVWLLFTYSGELLWQWPSPVRWLADGLAVSALCAFAWSVGIYNTREFLGLSQLKNSQSSVDDVSPLSISPLHRYVRHPWYFLGLVIIWTREMNASLLVTAVFLTLYVIVGAWLEERKLLNRYGRRYALYLDKVPGLIPRPWRRLSKQEAQHILELEGPP